MNKVCDTCLYGIRVEDNKLGCRYPGICHTQDGEKTAWTPKKEQQYADLKGRVVQDSLAAILLAHRF